MMSLLSIKDYEEYAVNNLDKSVCDYLTKGAQNDVTLRANVEAFARFRIRPRYMVDVSNRDLSLTIFGDTIRAPIGVSPSRPHNYFHSNGELETAKGASDSNSLMIVSIGATVSLEQIAQREPTLVKWFQLYIEPNRAVTLDLVRRAEQAGYRAIVITVDFPVIGIRYENTRNGYLDSEPSNRVNYLKYSIEKTVAMDATWSDLKMVKAHTSLPVIVKGVLTAEDARLAVNSGADGILVSNHGGRQLDDSPASLEALPEIVSEVGKEAAVFMDGGVRSGNDVFKALALGADSVFVGRPVLWGLYHGGANGVKSVFDILYNELDTVMALSGCATIADIKRSHVEHVDGYRNKMKEIV